MDRKFVDDAVQMSGRADALFKEISSGTEGSSALILDAFRSKYGKDSAKKKMLLARRQSNEMACFVKDCFPSPLHSVDR